MAQSGRGITVDNNGGSGRVVYQNASSMEVHTVLVKNTDGAAILRFVGQDATGAQQPYSAGYDWGPGVEYKFDLSPGESIVAVAAPAASALVNFYFVRSAEVGG